LERRRLINKLLLYYKILNGHCDMAVSVASGSASHVAIISNLLNNHVPVMSEIFLLQ